VTPRFKPGDAVTVRRAYPPGHIRTPYYIRGKRGVVERLCGSFANPEELAHGRSGLPAQPLDRYRDLRALARTGRSSRCTMTIPIRTTIIPTKTARSATIS
jgi:Nitrile hydratase beta subunit, C-terminal